MSCLTLCLFVYFRSFFSFFLKTNYLFCGVYFPVIPNSVTYLESVRERDAWNNERKGHEENDSEKLGGKQRAKNGERVRERRMLEDEINSGTCFMITLWWPKIKKMYKKNKKENCVFRLKFLDFLLVKNKETENVSRNVFL